MWSIHVEIEYVIFFGGKTVSNMKQMGLYCKKDACFEAYATQRKKENWSSLPIRTKVHKNRNKTQLFSLIRNYVTITVGMRYEIKNESHMTRAVTMF